MRTSEERLDMLDEMLVDPTERGLIMRTPEDDGPLDGRTIRLDGRELLNFGSCSYLGLELDPRMRQGVVDAVMRYGTQFSSSRSYLQAPPYLQLEAMLEEAFGGHVIVTPSTSLGHLAALPVLVSSEDAVVLDQQVHASVQMAAANLRAQGSEIELIRHNRMDRLERMIERLAPRSEKVWYFADGVYSMFADLAPFDELRELLARHPQLHLYVDDSHGMSWSGRHGRGPALEALGGHPRVTVIGSLNKSFAGAGAALVLPDAESRRRVRTLGGPMIFSGPVQPPMLGALLASAAIHLSPELEALQAGLRERIALCNALLAEHGLPLASTDGTPIRYIQLGLPKVAQDVVAALLDDGFYTNLAMFPAVPMKHAGVRFTLTLHHRPEDVAALAEALARHVPAAIAAGGEQAERKARRAAVAAAPAATGPALRLEHHRSILELDAAEWDGLLGDRGTFSAAGLNFLEHAFSHEARPEDRWDFHYYVVRDRAGRPVLATFFTCALWKDDMLSAPAVSRVVEERRAEDPYYLTSRTFAMGSLITEGDHVFLARDGDWRGALDLLLAAVGHDAERHGAATIVLRDLASSDRELRDALRERGFVAVAMPESVVVDAVPATDEAWLASLSPKARVHQRRDVLPWDDAFEVEVLAHGGRVPSDAELAHLHGLYAQVQARNLEINAFRLPGTLLRDMLAHPCWELVLLRRRPEAGGAPAEPPVAFGAHFIGREHYAPMIVGLDYDYVRSHHTYRQALRQALLRARAHGATRVPLGMGATFEKRRFGGRPEARLAFVQSSDHFAQEALAVHAAAVA